MKLSLVFPAYNEATSITKVIEDFSHYCIERKIEHEMIIVNDGSSDGTGTILRSLRNTIPFIRLVEHERNMGYGAALRSGFSAATGDYIFFTDADGQFAPEDLDATLPLLSPTTMVLGYRKNRAEGPARRLNAWLWMQCVALLLGLRVRDLNCAWKLFPRVVLVDSTLRANGAFISAELLFAARKKDLAFCEIPIHHYPRRSGTATGAKLRVTFRAFSELAYFLRNRAYAKRVPSEAP